MPIRTSICAARWRPSSSATSRPAVAAALDRRRARRLHRKRGCSSTSRSTSTRTGAIAPSRRRRSRCRVAAARADSNASGAAPARVAIELGCSVGRVVAQCPRTASTASSCSSGRFGRARRLLAGERVPYARRAIGRTYTTASATGIRRDGVPLVCGDVLDPPLRAGCLRSRRRAEHARLGRASAPAALRGRSLCERGGDVLLASPYAWQSTVMHESERFGGADPAGALPRSSGRAGWARTDPGGSRTSLDVAQGCAERGHLSDLYLRARKGT